MRRHVVLSAFACAPGEGSEEGIGWTWATALAEEHDVMVLTDRSNRAAVEAELEARPRASLRVTYVGPGIRATPLLGVYPYYYRWQRWALAAARSMHQRRAFDVAHHVTYGSFRVPCHLHELGVPLIWGPVGGGEGVPLAFFDPRWIGARSAAAEVARWAWSREVAVDPRVRRTVRGAHLCAFTTAQSAQVLGPPPRSVVMGNAQLDPADLALASSRAATAPPPDGMHVAFAGRLLGWKGPTLAVHAFARYARERPGARFDIYGDGPMAPRLTALAEELGVGDQVVLHGRIPRQALLRAYADHHAFLFPSFHDSGGFVVLEAMAAGLPVLCLDAGGPGDAVPPGAGVVVTPRTPARAVQELADGLLAMDADPGLWAQMSATARNHALDPASTPTVATRARQLYREAGVV